SFSSSSSSESDGEGGLTFFFSTEITCFLSQSGGVGGEILSIGPALPLNAYPMATPIDSRRSTVTTPAKKKRMRTHFPSPSSLSIRSSIFFPSVSCLFYWRRKGGRRVR
ncbi:hypothetical protein PENTCL1PPCAC_2635, partial [Pristionchus entomophagus]